jgi:hypothetical protein
MGRTIPSFRIASVEEQKEWKHFRQALDKQDRKIFDNNMFSITHLYNSACSYYAAANPVRIIQPIFMSIIFHHYKQLLKLKEEEGMIDKKGEVKPL